MSQDKGDLWDAGWAVICLALGEATGFLTVYPVLHEVPGFSREGLTLGFGLLLSATYFLMGFPMLEPLRRAVSWVARRIYGNRKTHPEKS